MRRARKRAYAQPAGGLPAPFYKPALRSFAGLSGVIDACLFIDAHPVDKERLWIAFRINAAVIVLFGQVTADREIDNQVKRVVEGACWFCLPSLLADRHDFEVRVEYLTPSTNHDISPSFHSTANTWKPSAVGGSSTSSPL